MPILVDLEHRPVTSKTEHCRLLQGRLCLLPCEVVAIWGVLLGVLVVVSAGFGNSAVVLTVASCAAGGVLLLAWAVWLHWRLRRRRRHLRQPTRIGGVVLLAIAALLAWLSLAFGWWLLIIAATALVPAAGLEVSARRRVRALRAAAVTVPPPRQAPTEAAATRRTEPVADVSRTPAGDEQAEPVTEEWEWDSRTRQPTLTGATR